MTGNQIAYADYLRKEAADRIDALHKAETRRLQEQEVALKEWSAQQDVRIRDLLAQWQMRRDQRQLELDAQKNAIQEAFNQASIARDYARLEQEKDINWQNVLLKANLARDENLIKKGELGLKQKTFKYTQFKDSKNYQLEAWKTQKQYGTWGTEQIKAYGTLLRGASSAVDAIGKTYTAFKKKK